MLLPSYYSPDFTPIEEVFSKVQNLLLRKAKARSLQVLLEASAQALGEVSKEDARGATTSSTADTVR